ncbi:MAG: DUF2235 domain-containing protein [Paracoccaceae bacterium]
MPKTLILLLDGTSNTISDRRTNILRLYGCLRKSETQIVYYDPGVGTIGAQGRWSKLAQDASEIWGMVTGMGIDDNVKRAYRFIVDHYDNGKAEGTGRDRICIFGFSRGAYTARMLAGFIHAIGLLERRNLNLLDHAWRAYKRIGEAEREQDFAEVRLYERILAPDRPPIHLLGLFDTVSSVIEPGRGLLPQLRHHAFTSRNPSVAHLRHAVALDERRRMFEPVLWPEGGEYLGKRFQPGCGVPQDTREVWFTGTHGDVGGGWPEAVSGLAKIPLLWMINETQALGIRYVTATVNRLVRGTHPRQPYVGPDAFASVNDSMTPGWRLLEYLPLPTTDGGLNITRARKRTLPQHAHIHASVLARADRAGPPDNLPDSYRIEGMPGDWSGL